MSFPKSSTTTFLDDGNFLNQTHKKSDKSVGFIKPEFLLEPAAYIQQSTGTYSSNHESVSLEINPKISPKKPFLERFTALQKWEGVVVEVEQETFTAHLTPLVGEGGDLEAEIFLEELDQEDRHLIQPGAVFYWSIGYMDTPSGRKRSSIIRFRRLPVWTPEEINEAKMKAAQLRTLFDAE